MKRIIKRNKMNIFILALCILMSLVFIKYNMVNADSLLNGSFLSINAIFAGFLFTSLSIIVGILDKEIIMYLDKGGYLDGYINGIVIGLLTHLLSVILELFLVNINLSYDFDVEIGLKKLIFFLLITGIMFFIKSMFNILKLIKIIRQQN